MARASTHQERPNREPQAVPTCSAAATSQFSRVHPLAPRWQPTRPSSGPKFQARTHECGCRCLPMHQKVKRKRSHSAVSHLAAPWTAVTSSPVHGFVVRHRCHCSLLCLLGKGSLISKVGFISRSVIILSPLL